ncbi:MAG: ATP-binding cassette domain-containing protein [Lentisphaeria bacterium]|nr:ATP-binding cassette domain-containing protein [Lentisphaeria bacterium]
MTEQNSAYEQAIDVNGATVFLGGREILHNISWQVKKGDRCFILGANGAGKTTLVKMLMGYAWPLFGAHVSVLGQKFGQTNLIELRKRVAWVSPYMQQMADPELRGLELVVSGVDSTFGLFRKMLPEEEAKAISILEKLKCVHLKDQQLMTMSSGEQVKILIARAMMNNPELLILDEPSVYLDIAGREFLLETIAEMAHDHPEITIVFITQRIEDIMPVFDKGMILKSGNIQSYGKREEVLTEANLSEAFDLNIILTPGKNGRLWSMIG